MTPEIADRPSDRNSFACYNSCEGPLRRQDDFSESQSKQPAPDNPMHNTGLDSDNVNLLWTGGWDSTFQLLQLLILDRRQVTPVYLIDAERRSTGVEIRTMKRIKQRVLDEFPFARELLRPTRFFAVDDIPPDAEIEAAFQSVLKKSFLGDQYRWLPRFCKAHRLTDLQLCIHLHDKAHSILSPVVAQSDDPSQRVFRIDPRFCGTKEHALFRWFAFPVFDSSKLQMQAAAQERGWQPVMEMTWFCHSPARNTKPCGRCNPCLYTIEEGLGWRIPAKNRLASFLSFGRMGNGRSA